MLLDAPTLYFRAFHALPVTLVDGHGRPNNAIRGFLDALRVLRDTYRPDRIITCWDEDWRPQWRVNLVPSYKTHRVGTDTPDELAPQVPVIAEACRALGMSVVGAAGLEADDVIAALALAADGPVDIVSGDRDLTQLVSDAARRRLILLGTGGNTIFDDAAVVAAYGVPPERYADLAVLRGDPSDGLPGAEGIGVKTAARYLVAFGDLEGVLAAAERAVVPITPAKAAVLVRDADALRAARRVVTLGPAEVTVIDEQRDASALERLGREFGVSGALGRW